MITQFRCLNCGTLFVQNIESGKYAVCPKLCIETPDDKEFDRKPCYDIEIVDRKKDVEIPRLPLYIEKIEGDSQADDGMIYVQRLVDEHKKKMGIDPLYISVSKNDSRRWQFDIFDPKTIRRPDEKEKYYFRGLSDHPIPIRVRE